MGLDTAVYLVGVDQAMHDLGAPEDRYVQVERLVNAASARIEGWCGSRFRRRTATLRLDGDETPLLDLGSPFIPGSIASVKVGGDDLSSPVSLGATDYVAYPARGQLFRASGWPAGVRNVEVVLEVGYAEVPHPVREACLQLVRHWYGDPPGGAGLRSERLGDYAYERFPPGGVGLPDSDIPDEVKALLAPYRRMWWA